jgi:ribonuclease HI
VRLYSNSNNLINGITKWVIQWRENDWRIRDGKQVQNLELWKALIQATSAHKIEWNLIKQKDANEVMDRCDEIAYAVADYYNGADYLCEWCGESGGAPNQRCLWCRDAGTKF